MATTGIIDGFLNVFTSYIDAGFGLLGGEVNFLATTLVLIDISLAALFWAWGTDEDIIARLIKKTLFVGVFAYLISNWNLIARWVFESFAGLGLIASGSTLTAAQFLQPGRIAQVGLDSGRPILDAISTMLGPVAFFENFIQIVILLLAWAIVLLTFFILAIQLFVSLIEFKLTTLAGFLLVPFGLFNKTAFMAERVLGLVLSSGVKLLVLAVIAGIGSTLFATFTGAFAGPIPTIDEALSLMLGALSLLALGIFGPGIANGIIAGGPQLGAGAAVSTGLAVGGAAIAAGAATRGAAGLAATGARGGMAGMRALGQRLGLGAASAATSSPLKPQGAPSGGGPAPTSSSTSSSNMPAWAKRMHQRPALKDGVRTTAHALRSGDAHGAGASVSLKGSDDV